MTDYILHTDGGSRGNPGPAGYGAVICSPDGTILYETAGYLPKATNNVAEYNGLILGLETIAQLNPGAYVHVRADSNLMVNQMSGSWKIKDARLAKLADKAHSILAPMQVTYEWVPRDRNKDADRLANEAMDARGSIYRVCHEDARDDDNPGDDSTGDDSANQADNAPTTSPSATAGDSPTTPSPGTIRLVADPDCTRDISDVNDVDTWLQHLCQQAPSLVYANPDDIVMVIAGIGGFKPRVVRAAFQIMPGHHTDITCDDDYRIRCVNA